MDVRIVVVSLLCGCCALSLLYIRLAKEMKNFNQKNYSYNNDFKDFLFLKISIFNLYVLISIENFKISYFKNAF